MIILLTVFLPSSVVLIVLTLTFWE